jgi:type II secretory pathway pseudopilin PulG
MSRPGFTIIELLSLLALSSFFAATGVRAYFLRPDITLENAATLLAHDLRAAQNRSAYLGEVSCFSFLDDGDGYVVTDETGEIVRNPRTEHTFERRYSSDGVFDGVYVSEVDAEPGRSLIYDGRGEATYNLAVTLVFGQSRRVVRVEPKSGRVTIEGTSSGWTDSGY